jgi:mannose-6-phosphate isomerase
MSEFYKLRNKARHYDWGSPVDIPRLLGITTNGTPPTSGEPWAELWLGSRSGFSSIAVLDSGETSLEDLIAREPRRFLGEETARRYGTLPFLLKLLSAEKPLSIQAHPTQEQAREGFERENQAGLPLDSPRRNYKDSNHKPEIICALTPFTGLCGFRGVDEIRDLLAVFLEPAPPVLCEGFVPLTRALINCNPAIGGTATGEPPAVALHDFLAGLFDLSQEVREALTEYILGCEHGCGASHSDGASYNDAMELMRDLARLYPGDPAVIAPLYLNVFRLEPGEAVFLEAGVLHAYIHGFGVELMTDSDNVLRGGLTPKHIDAPELMKILVFKPFKPHVITPNDGCFNYPAPCDEFSLTRICDPADICLLSPGGPSICIVTEGELIIAAEDMETVVKQGESLFIPPVISNESPLSLKGSFTLFIASTGRGASTSCRCGASCGIQACTSTESAGRRFPS